MWISNFHEKLYDANIAYNIAKSKSYATVRNLIGDKMKLTTYQGGIKRMCGMVWVIG